MAILKVWAVDNWDPWDTFKGLQDQIIFIVIRRHPLPFHGVDICSGDGNAMVSETDGTSVQIEWHQTYCILHCPVLVAKEMPVWPSLIKQ